MPTDDHLKLPRSPLWPALRAHWLKDHPTCAACGGKKHIEVHHKVPVHVSRSMELDATNLITLCESNTSLDVKSEKHCHLIIGHLGNWYAYNRHVDKSAYDALLATYSASLAPHHGAPVPPASTEPAAPTNADPAKAPDNTDVEVAPERFTNRKRRI